MKKYERLIKKLHEIDKLSYDAFEKSLTVLGTPEYEELKRIQDNYENESLSLFAELKGCIKWYCSRAKTADDFVFIKELREQYDMLYGHMICDLSDADIEAQAMQIIGSLMDSIPELKKLQQPAQTKQQAQKQSNTNPSNAAANKRSFIDIEQLRDMYINQGLTLEQCGKAFNIPKSTLGRILRENGIKKQNEEITQEIDSPPSPAAEPHDDIYSQAAKKILAVANR